MEITCQLRFDKLTKKGYAPIQITICWAGHRVCLLSGESVQPKHWDEVRQLVASVPGSYYAHINGRLNQITQAVQEVQQGAETRRERLSEARVRALVEDVKNPGAAAAPVPAAKQLASLSVPELFKRWMIEQGAKVSKRTGKPRARTTLSNLNSTYEKLRAFETAYDEPLLLATMDLLRFYQPFWHWLTEDLYQRVNTFGKHIARLRAFLSWCEDRNLKVNRQYRRFEAPSLYVGVDALTEEELASIAALDFTSAPLRTKLYCGYAARQDSAIDSPEVGAYLAEVELARDKFLECAYSALHTGDADAVLRPDLQHVPGNADRVLEVRREKTSPPCHVPFFDDEVFKLVALTAKYESRGPYLVPPCPAVNRHLKTIAHLVGLTRLKLTTKVGRKTFVTLKLMRGTPTRRVMMATGHTTEASFNHYLGVHLVKLLGQYRKYQILPAA